MARRGRDILKAVAAFAEAGQDAGGDQALERQRNAQANDAVASFEALIEAEIAERVDAALRARGVLKDEPVAEAAAPVAEASPAPDVPAAEPEA